MDIKRSLSSDLNQKIASEKTDAATPTTPASKPDVKIGTAQVKDHFETAKQDSLKGMLGTSSSSTVNASSSYQQRLTDAKQEITNYFASPENPGLSFPATERFLKVSDSQEGGDSVFTMMMEYQKMMNKEAREERKTQRASQATELIAKESKLELDNQKIDNQKREAGEKFDSALTEASYEMIIGVAGKIAASDHKEDLDQMSERLSELKEASTHIRDEILAKSDDEGERTTANNRYHSYISWLNDHKDD